jgi:hypothetical protein
MTGPPPIGGLPQRKEKGLNKNKWLNRRHCFAFFDLHVRVEIDDDGDDICPGLPMCPRVDGVKGDMKDTNTQCCCVMALAEVT